MAVMQNIFYNKKISKIFDLKGSLRGRFAAHIHNPKDDNSPDTPAHGSEASSALRKKGSDHGSEGLKGDSDEEASANGKSKGKSSGTLLDGDFLEFTSGRPMPMNDRAKAVFHMSILNVSSHRRIHVDSVHVGNAKYLMSFLCLPHFRILCSFRLSTS